MADNTIQARGTELFISTDGTAVLKFNCPTAITGGGVTVNTQEIDCLDAPQAYDKPTGKKVKPWNVPFIYQGGDTSHAYVLDMLNSADLSIAEIPFAIAWPDGSADPTITAGAFVPAAGRTQITGKGYITDVSVDINNGDVIRGSITLSPTSTVVTKKAA